jgi:hypothetical protein
MQKDVTNAWGTPIVTCSCTNFGFGTRAELAQEWVPLTVRRQDMKFGKH